MARTVKVAWDLPTVRASGKPLDPSQIAGAEVAMSADEGKSYGVLGTFPPAVRDTLVNELEDGTWFFKGVVVDIGGKRSADVVAQITIITPDDTPPGPLTLRLSLA